MEMLRDLRAAVSLLVAMLLLLGVGYPLLVLGLGQTLFPRQAAGSLVYRGQTLVGSRLIGQQFTAAKYFWGRPSATTPQPYNALASGGSNVGPLNPALLDSVDANKKLYMSADPDNTSPIPVDLVTASGSGLDPDISVAGALFQAERVAKARNLPQARVIDLIRSRQQAPLFGIMGEAHINVLDLNMALDSSE
jgi:potassium-transporting ATPase KdpC subunit